MTFDVITQKIKELDNKKIALAGAECIYALGALEKARAKNIASGILIGDEEEIIKSAKKLSIDLSNYEVIHKETESKACEHAVSIVANKKADVLMKGLVETSSILKAVLDSDKGIKDSPVLSHVGVFEHSKFDRLIFVTDAALNIEPNLEQKEHIINNAVKVAKGIGVGMPKVAVICAKEKVNSKMKETLVADALQKMNEQGTIKDCLVCGPISLDIALSKEAAEHKKFDNPVGGNADILLTSNIDSGNILYKSFVTLTDSKAAGLIVGAKAPIIVNSRADSEQTKFLSIVLACSINV